VVIVEGDEAVFGVNVGRPIKTNGTLLRSCARTTRSSQITLGGLVKGEGHLKVTYTRKVISRKRC